MTLKQETVDALQGLTSSSISTQKLTLEVVEGPHKGQTLQLEQEFVRIGRAPWCDLVLEEDQWVSNEHCECWLEEQGLRVRDLSSRNGIQLNGVPVFDARFVPGTRLLVGQSLIQLHASAQTRSVPIYFRDKTGTLVGKSQAMRKIFSLLERIAQRKVSTLLTGETGTGKTSLAHAIHLQHHAPHAPFVIVNCGALPASLIEASLFGYEKGAFTGANKTHQGFFQQAHGGTLLLDEIAELPLDLQPKLLDVIERRKLRRLGSTKENDLDFHLLTATNRNLQKECEEGRFREDLYYRLCVIELQAPPLRERKEDLPLIVEAMLKELHPDHPIYISSHAVSALEERLWPGNIRELRNTLERTITFLEGNTIQPHDLPPPASTVPEPQRQSSDDPNPQSPLPSFPLSAHDPPISLKDILKDTERTLIAQALEETGQSASKAAKLLRLSESWIYSRIKRYGLAERHKSSH